MVEQGYKFLYGPIHSMAEFFETRMKNLGKSIPQVFLQETARKVRKGPRKGKL